MKIVENDKSALESLPHTADISFKKILVIYTHICAYIHTYISVYMHIYK